MSYFTIQIVEYKIQNLKCRLIIIYSRIAWLEHFRVFIVLLPRVIRQRIQFFFSIKKQLKMKELF